MNKTIKSLDYLTLGCLNCVLITATFSKAAVESLIVMALLFWLIRKTITKVFKINNEKFFPKTPINRPIVAFTIVCFLSALNSVNLNISLVSLIGKTLENIALFFVVIDTFNTKKRINSALVTLFVSLAALVMDCAFQYFTGKDLFRYFTLNDDKRLKASFSNANDLAGWLILTVPVFIYLGFLKSWTKKILKISLIGLSLLVMICLILTFSRGALIAIFISCFIFAFYFRKKAFILLIFPVIFLLIYIFTPILEIYSFNFTKGKGSISVIARLDLWERTTKLIADYPILGSGPGTYVSLIGRYNKDATPNTSYPHNSFLQIAAEIGIIGLLAFLWIIIKIFLEALKYRNKLSTNTQKCILLGLSAGLMAFLIQSFFDTNLFSLQLVITFWLLTGLMISTIRVEAKNI